MDSDAVFCMGLMLIYLALVSWFAADLQLKHPTTPSLSTQNSAAAPIPLPTSIAIPVSVSAGTQQTAKQTSETASSSCPESCQHVETFADFFSTAPELQSITQVAQPSAPTPPADSLLARSENFKSNDPPSLAKSQYTIPILTLFKMRGCHACLRFVKTWERAKLEFGSLIGFVEIDCSQNQSTCRQAAITSYPTVLFTPSNSSNRVLFSVGAVEQTSFLTLIQSKLQTGS